MRDLPPEQQQKAPGKKTTIQLAPISLDASNVDLSSASTTDISTIDTQVIPDISSGANSPPADISTIDTQTIPDIGAGNRQLVPYNPISHIFPDPPELAAGVSRSSEAEVDDSGSTRPAWPPPPGTYKIRRAGLSMPLMVLICSLAFLLIAGGLGLIAFSETRQYQITLNHVATVQATQTAGPTHSVQSTVGALGTAQSNIQTSATAQTLSTTTASNSNIGSNATATALGNLYTRSTNGPATLDDPLSDDTGTGRWDLSSGATNTGCIFITNQYHAKEAQQNRFQPCIAQGTSFSNFIYQIHVSILSGGQAQAGLLFRSNSSNTSYYFFHIDHNGNYGLDLYTDAAQPINLAQGTSSTILSGLDRNNQLAVIASNASLSLYINGQYVTTIQDSTLSSGKIGVGVLDADSPVDAIFSNAQVWQLTSTPQ